MLDNYESNGVFISSSLDSDVFTIIAKDNIDLNARSTKIKQHFHGISMTVMQFPQTEIKKNTPEPLYDLSTEPRKKLQLPHDYVNLDKLPFETVSLLLTTN